MVADHHADHLGRMPPCSSISLNRATLAGASSGFVNGGLVFMFFALDS